MNSNKCLIVSMLAVSSLAACSKSTVETGAKPESRALAKTAPAVTYTPADKSMGDKLMGDKSSMPGKMSGPVSISYRIIGQPVVGQPVAIDLRVSSALGPQTIRLDYRINDSTALQLAKSQPASMTLSADDRQAAGVRQVRVVPMREGRLYLNVSATIDTERGSMSTVTAIPIQVGDAPRYLEQNGETQTDAEGNLIKVLPAAEEQRE